VLSRVTVPRPRRLADCTVARARGFGITAGIHAMEDYDRTQAWARAFANAGFEGVRYRLSHDPRAHGIGIALFGSAGEEDWLVPTSVPIPRAVIKDAVRRFGLLVVPTP
jgi:RES domain